MKRIARSALVGHAAAAIYALVEAIEDYPQFLPWCRAATVHERTGERTLATLTVGVAGVSQSFTTENRNTPPAAIEMRLVRGPFRHFSGRWRFEALGEHAAKIEFALEYEFASRVAARALEPVFGGLADSMVDAFKRRADALHGDARR